MRAIRIDFAVQAHVWRVFVHGRIHDVNERIALAGDEKSYVSDLALYCEKRNKNLNHQEPEADQAR